MGVIDPKYVQYDAAAPAVPVASTPTLTKRATDLVAASYVTYATPAGGSSSNDGLPGSTRCPSNVLNTWMEPSYHEYPLPAIVVDSGTGSPTPTPSVSSPTSPATSAALMAIAAQRPAGGAAPVALMTLPGQQQPTPVAIVPLQILPTVAPTADGNAGSSSTGGGSATSGSSSGSSTSGSGSSGTSASGSGASSSPVNGMPVTPPQTLRTMVTNPAFPPAPAGGTSSSTSTKTHRRSQADELAILLGARRVRQVKHSGKGGHTTDAIEIDAAPIALICPQNCNALEVTLGEIEPVPGGKEADIADLVDAGKVAITDAAGTEVDELDLTPGVQVFLHIPWRAPSSAKIPAGVARRLVKTEFFKNVQNY